MQSIHISDLYSLSLKALRRDGVLLSPSQIWNYRGVVTLSRRSGYSEESVSFEISLQSSGEGTGSITFEYLRDGTPVKYSYRLEERESNLPSGGSFFVIVDRGREVKKLYLYSGYFVPRHRLRGLEYETQAQSKYWRGVQTDGVLTEVQSLFKPGRKVHYRGRLTPYGENITRHYNQIRNWGGTLLSDPLTRRQLKTWERYLPESEDLESRIRPLTLPKFLR